MPETNARRRSTLPGRLAMSGLSEVIQFPAAAARTRARNRLDNEISEEAALVRRVQASDEIAFREIVDRYQGKVFSIICGILRNRNDAEDIAQLVFMKIYFSIHNFDSRSSLLTWIYRITVNECYDYLRKRRVRKLVYESDFSAEEVQRLETSDVVVDPLAPMDQQLAQHELVMKLLSKVSEQERSLILLKEVEGHSVEELVALTGLKENTIKVKLLRTRHKLLKAAQRLGTFNMLLFNSGQTG
jgi:RNA polymerase sigma-70 factor, ECF subfamily